jgi:ABC-type sugar transport system substrate-binding protein
MRRVLVLLCVVAFLAALPLSHIAMAAPAAKVAICHVNSANDVIDLGFFGTFVFGMEIEVAESAVPAHLAHGDSTEYFPVDEEFVEFLEWITDRLGIDFKLPNADCVFYAP